MPKICLDADRAVFRMVFSSLLSLRIICKFFGRDMEHPENESRSGGEQSQGKPDDEVRLPLVIYFKN